MGVRAWREEVVAGRGGDADEDPGAADLLWRRAADSEIAEGACCAGEVAWRAADHVSRRSWSVERASEARVRLEIATAARCHRSHRGLDVSRRMDHLRQPSRCVGQWR